VTGRVIAHPRGQCLKIVGGVSPCCGRDESPLKPCVLSYRRRQFARRHVAASTAMTTSCDLGRSGFTGRHLCTSGGPGWSKTMAFGNV
jgi:hypothetical protein